jgi:hypothetical protein
VWVDIYVLGYYGNSSQEGTSLNTQVLLYRPEREKTSGRRLSTKNSKARKSGQEKKWRK